MLTLLHARPIRRNTPLVRPCARPCVRASAGQSSGPSLAPALQPRSRRASAWQPEMDTCIDVHIDMWYIRACVCVPGVSLEISYRGHFKLVPYGQTHAIGDAVIEFLWPMARNVPLTAGAACLRPVATGVPHTCAGSIKCFAERPIECWIECSAQAEMDLGGFHEHHDAAMRLVQVGPKADPPRSLGTWIGRSVLRHP